MAHVQKPDFVFRRNGRAHLNRRGTSIQSTTGSRGVRISSSNAGYTIFRGSVKGTSYPLHSPVPPSLPLTCVTVCHFKWTLLRRNKVSLGFSYLANVYPQGKREHKAYEANTHIYDDIRIRRGCSLKFIRTPTIKLLPYLAPSKPDATPSLLSSFFPYPARAHSGGRVGCPPHQVCPIHNILPTVYLYMCISRQTKCSSLNRTQ